MSHICRTMQSLQRGVKFMNWWVVLLSQLWLELLGHRHQAFELVQCFACLISTRICTEELCSISAVRYLAALCRRQNDQSDREAHNRRKVHHTAQLASRACRNRHQSIHIFPAQVGKIPLQDTLFSKCPLEMKVAVQYQLNIPYLLTSCKHTISACGFRISSSSNCCRKDHVNAC